MTVLGRVYCVFVMKKLYKMYNYCPKSAPQSAIELTKLTVNTITVQKCYVKFGNFRKIVVNGGFVLLHVLLIVDNSNHPARVPRKVECRDRRLYLRSR